MRNNHLWRSSAILARRTVLFCGIALLFLCFGPLSHAQEHTRKTVRVPIFPFERMMVLDEDRNPISGYAYEYLQTIAAYAGWDIEYDPCDSFSEALDKLFAGEVDLFYEISHTEERAKVILFPDEPMGHEFYYLYAMKGNTSITPDDFQSMNGKTVGVTRGTMQIDLLKQWCQKKNVDLKLVEYEFESQKESDLLAGKIDLDLEVSILAKPDFSAVERIGSSAYYLVANKNRPDLIDDIDTTMEKILNNDLYYFTRLQERYIADTIISLNLTTEERNWIENHKVLRVGFFDNYLPFSTLDKSGNPAGAGKTTSKSSSSAISIRKRATRRSNPKRSTSCSPPTSAIRSSTIITSSAARSSRRW